MPLANNRHRAWARVLRLRQQEQGESALDAQRLFAASGDFLNCGLAENRYSHFTQKRCTASSSWSGEYLELHPWSHPPKDVRGVFRGGFSAT